MDMNFRQTLGQELRQMTPEFNEVVIRMSNLVADMIYRKAKKNADEKYGEIESLRSRRYIQTLTDRMTAHQFAPEAVHALMLDKNWVTVIKKIDVVLDAIINNNPIPQNIEQSDYRIPPYDSIVEHLRHPIIFQLELLMEPTGKFAEKRHKLEAAQSMEVAMATEEDIPAIEEEYNRQLLVINELISGNRADFREKMRGGFVLPFDHPHRTGKSDREELREAIHQPFVSGKGYTLNLLLKQGNEVKGWYEGFVPDPTGMSKKAIAQEKSDIRHGNTGKVKYDKEMRKMLINSIPVRSKLMMIMQATDTDFVASRAYAIGTMLLKLFNPDTTLLDTYWLRRLRISGMKPEPIGNNWSSQRFCKDRHYEEIGVDADENGEETIRSVNGIDYSIQPGWTRAMAPFDDSLSAADRLQDQVCAFYHVDRNDDKLTTVLLKEMMQTYQIATHRR